MANATTLQFGAVNSSGARDALFLKQYGGEVMTAFEEMNEVLDKHMIRTIANGKSAAFPATWKLSAAYHTPGAEIVGQSSNTNERVIIIDDLLISDAFIANIDEAKAHYDVRSIYSTESGRALKRTFNKNVLQVGVLAARAAATVTGANGGTVLTQANFKTDATVLATGLFSAAQTLDEKDIPDEGERWAFLKPAQYFLLAQNTTVINKDWGGAGSYSDGKVLRIAGIELVKSNNLPVANVASGPTAYQGLFNTTAGLVMTKQAVGTVKLLDLAVESEYDIRRQGTLIVSKYAMGHGILRPECAIELRTGTPS